MTRAGRVVALALAGAALLSALPSRAADAPSPAPAAGEDLDALSAAIAPAIVSIKVIYTWAGGEEEDSWWSHGVVVDPGGLVLVGLSTDSEGRVRIKAVHVLFEDDPTEWPAVLVAKDTILGLAWIQVLGVGERSLAHVDLAKGVADRAEPPRLGEPLFGVTRLGRGFDYAPAVRRIYFTSRITSPRRMWDFAGDFGEVGLPVFDLKGRPVALLAEQASAEGAGEDGGTSSEAFALPLDAVLKSLEQARKRVPEALKKAEGPAKDAPKEPVKDAPGGDARPPAPSTPRPPDVSK
ncbi:MAG TPA: hypothetical protein VND21_09120 [Planctomycetota bacterium]|nr:hypothetical protein [Planctomycetota bacterium]